MEYETQASQKPGYGERCLGRYPEKNARNVYNTTVKEEEGVFDVRVPLVQNEDKVQSPNSENRVILIITNFYLMRPYFLLWQHSPRCHLTLLSRFS